MYFTISLHLLLKSICIADLHDSPNPSMTELVFGTGGRFGRLSKSLASNLVSYAIDHGIYSFDTGYEYCSRRSQPLLFDILRHNSKFLSGIVKVSTKFSAPQAPGELTLLVDESLSQLSSRDYLDTIFLWGPKVSDLHCEFLLEELAALKMAGKILGWGVNTHCTDVLSHILGFLHEFPLENIMLDYNLLQQDRDPLIRSFADKGVEVWAGTVLCQGFLSQSLFNMFLRTRSISYLMRALFQPSTRRLLGPSKVLREYFKSLSRKDALSLPLAFVDSNLYVSKIPIGMLSISSMQSNLSVLHNPPDPSILRDASLWAYNNCQV